MKRCTENTEFAPAESHNEFQPIIDLNPNDETCIYSTLLFVIKQAQRYNVPVPCITFDLPLWIKAVKIATAEGLDIVCRLGGFHTLTSFLGSIGNLMKGSGLQELLEEIYPPKTVEHILSGKAYYRPLREHTIVEAALSSLLLDILQNESDIDFDMFSTFYNQAMSGENTAPEFECEAFKIVYDKLSALKSKLLSNSRTAQLWLLYIY